MSGAVQHYVTSAKWWARLFLAMPDHAHALLSFPAAERMDSVIRNWKRFVAKKAEIEWQDGFFDHRLRDNENFLLKAEYIRMNPVRAGLVADPREWKYVWQANAAGAAR
jgi:putative transposase